jgi:steroid delta-isomerase-like uncharacterized protein
MNYKIQKMLRTVSILLAIVIVFTIGCQQQQDYSKELKPIIEKGVAIWNNGNLEEVDELWAPNVVRSANQLPEVEGIEGIKEVITSFRTAYPDGKLTVDEEVFSDNRIVIRWKFTGTNTGEGEMPPTGKQIEIWGLSLLHLENGKITREYVAWDNQPLLEQLGFTITPPSSDTN